MKKVFNHRTNSKNLILAAAAFFAASVEGLYAFQGYGALDTI